MTNVFKQMNESIFKSAEITWFDLDGIMDLDETRYVRFVLDTHGVNGNYEGHWVEVYNRQNGLISKKFFRFKNHMEFIHRDTGQNYFHIWLDRDGKLDWYISKPKNVDDYVNVILQYISKIK